jgi:hypothetical protein
VRFISSMLLAASLFCCFAAVHTVQAVYPGDAEPAYAKWGRLAVFETGKRYPDYDIVDYLYLGRNLAQNGESVERFKLWLKKGSSEKGVIITITLDSRGRFKSISFRETLRDQAKNPRLSIS